MWADLISNIEEHEQHGRRPAVNPHSESRVITKTLACLQHFWNPAPLETSYVRQDTTLCKRKTEFKCRVLLYVVRHLFL